MAIVFDLSEEAEPPAITALLKDLKIPADYARFEALGDASLFDELDRWKEHALVSLRALRELLSKRDGVDEDERADVVFAVAPFRGEGEWTSEEMGELAETILHLTGSLDVPFLEKLLMQYVKPVFQATPHPLLNTETGRKLPRAAGGPMATQDVYEGQAWKAHPGIGNVLLWCVQHIESDAYERLWYLVVPPVMTLLDDYEAKYKLEGILSVRALLVKAPPDLLRRTGVSELLLSSIQRALTFLHSPSTPKLIRAAVPTAIDLILRTTQKGSEQQFNQLCAILGEGIIGSVWMYGSQDADAIEASVDSLPELIKVLRIGTTRYLKALILQLTHPLHPNPHRPARPSLQISSLRALLCLIQGCSPRMHAWKGTILESIAKCWVTLVDAAKADPESLALKEGLRNTAVQLAFAAPSVLNNYAALIARDEDMFGPLLGNLPAPKIEG